MKNKKVTYHNNHLMYINQDVMEILQKKSLWIKCKEVFTTIIIGVTFVTVFISMVYCLYLTKTL